MAYVAHLTDPTYGGVYEVAETKEEAVNKAWKRFALNWYANPSDFSGEIRGDKIYDEKLGMIGVVREIDF